MRTPHVTRRTWPFPQRKSGAILNSDTQRDCVEAKLGFALPLAYNARRVPSASFTNSANRFADPEDAPRREGDAGQRDARDVQYWLEPDLIGRDSKVPFGRSPAFLRHCHPRCLRPSLGLVFRLLDTTSP